MSVAAVPPCGPSDALLNSRTVSSCLSYAFVAALVWGLIVRHRTPLKAAYDEERALLTTPPVSMESKKESGRSDWIDGCRFWLVAAVIFGHAVAFPCAYVPASKYYLNPALVWAATFHMPGLAFLSGLCSQGPLTTARAKRLFTRVALPYIFAHLSQWAFYCRAYGVCGGNSLDGGVEWYLLSLLIWRLLSVPLVNLKPVILLALAFTMGILSGYCLNIFSVFLTVGDVPILISVTHRTLTFFPFFVIGVVCDPVILQGLIRRWPWLRVGAGALLAGSLALFFLQARFGAGLSGLQLGAIGDFNFDYISPRINPEEPWAYLIPKACGTEHTLAGLHRAGRYMLSCVFVSLFCLAVPSRPSWFSHAGRHTIYPYLLHVWPVTFLSLFLVNHPAWSTWSIGWSGHGGSSVWLLVAGLSLCFSYFTTHSSIRWFFSPLIEPDWVLR